MNVNVGTSGAKRGREGQQQQQQQVVLKAQMTDEEMALDQVRTCLRTSSSHFWRTAIWTYDVFRAFYPTPDGIQHSQVYIIRVLIIVPTAVDGYGIRTSSVFTRCETAVNITCRYLIAFVAADK